MSNKGDNLTGETVTTGNSSKAFSAHELAALKLPRYPTTPKGWYAVVKQPGWRTLLEAGKGPGGTRQVFIPPPEVIKLIEERQRENLQYPKTESKAFHSRESGFTVAPDVSEFARVGGGVKAELLSPSAEWLYLAVGAINEAGWLPDSVKANKKAQSVLVMRLFNFLVLNLGSSDAQWQWLADHPESLQHALHFVYDIGQMDGAHLNQSAIHP